MAVVICKSASRLQQFYPVFEVTNPGTPNPPQAMSIPDTLMFVRHTVPDKGAVVIGIVVDESIKIMENLFLTSIIVAGTIRLHLQSSSHAISDVKQDKYLSYEKDNDTIKWKIASTDDIYIARVLTFWKPKKNASRIELDVAVLPHIHRYNEQMGNVKDKDDGNILKGVDDARANAQCTSFVRHCPLFLNTDEVFYSSIIKKGDNIKHIPDAVLVNRRLWSNRKSIRQFETEISKGPICVAVNGNISADIAYFENNHTTSLDGMFYQVDPPFSKKVYLLLADDPDITTTFYVPRLTASQQAGLINAIAKAITDDEIRILTLGW